MSIKSSLTSLWCFGTIAVYSASYWSTKDAIADLTKPFSDDLAQLETTLLIGGLVGALFIGIVADQTNARVSLNITLLFSALIYAVVFAALGGYTRGLERPVAFALKFFTVLQHTMQAMMTYAVIRGTMKRSKSGVMGLALQVSLGYSFGSYLANKYAASAKPVDLAAIAFLAHAVAVVLSYLWNAPVGVVMRVEEGNKVRYTVAPGTKRSIFAVLLNTLPLLGFVLAVRMARHFVTSSRTFLEVGDAPFWSTWSVGVDLAAGVIANLFVVPAVLLFCEGPGSVLAVVLGAMVLVRSAMMYDQPVLDDERQAPLFHFALTIGGALLYNIPTILIGYAAEVGTKGRVLAIQNIVSSLAYYKGKVIAQFLTAQIEKIAPSLAPGVMLSEHELDFFAFALCASFAFVFLPAVAYAEPSTIVSSSRAAAAPVEAAASSSSSAAGRKKRR